MEGGKPEDDQRVQRFSMRWRNCASAKATGFLLDSGWTCAHGRAL